MAAVTIRRFQASDEAAITVLSRRLSEGFAAWRDPDRIRSTIAGWIKSTIDTHGEPDHLVLVAESDAQVCAFIAAKVQDHYISGRDAYIGELVVDSEFEGRGIAQALIREVERWASEKQCERITLQTGAANERARHFYEKLGFAYEDVSFARELDH